MGSLGLLSDRNKFEFPHPLELDPRLHASSHLDISNNKFCRVTTGLKRIYLKQLQRLIFKSYKHHISEKIEFRIKHKKQITLCSACIFCICKTPNRSDIMVSFKK